MARRDDATEILPPSAERAEPVVDHGLGLLGRTLGKFEILEELGKGGSGEVYLAEQVQLGRSAVIKVLRREVAAAPNKVERFLREAKLASRLDHPYAAHVYAFGAEPDGVLWIAMEHVKGVTLDELIARRGAMPAAVFAPLFGRLCEVVHSAHELGIVHRDIKGANVMVIERAGQLLPKLLDFGIAKGSEDGETTPGVEGDALTGHGATLGSPHYMSPEQWSAPGSVDARADIYALGVLAYRCVAGELPFHGLDRAALPGAHLAKPPPPLPDRVPLEVASTIERALAKQPDQRWPTALAFGEAMSRAVGTATPEAVPLLDPDVRDAWTERGPQPIADAVARLASATTTVEADATLRELVAIACRWLAVLALAQLPEDATTPDVREKARETVGRDTGAPWLELARAVAAAIGASLFPELRAALIASEPLEVLAQRLDDRGRTRTFAGLAADIAAVGSALDALEMLLAHRLVVGRVGGAESWRGVRKRKRDRVVVWGEPLDDGLVALLDDAGTVVAKLSPLVQVVSPLPSAEPELFFLWRSARGQARLVAAPWGFERDDAAAAERLAMLTTEDGGTVEDMRDDASPYPGLASYGVADAERFVGREREVEALANRLVRAPLIAVLGPSGAGKSSFMHAGVMPRLAENYELITMRPGRHPMHALAALPTIEGDTLDGEGIIASLRARGERAPRGLVVVIDQLEELVTLCTDASERTRFAETLAAAADGPGSPVRVVVTLRDDFASVIESEEAFRGRFEVFVLATPLPEALRRIVTEPARRAQVTVDPRVVDDMVAEVAGRPASLPLLSFTASQLWLSRDRAARKITYEAYEKLGGVAGALATYADQIYGSLAHKDQEAVRDLFSRLVASDGTRIPFARNQLPDARGVLGHLIDARLLVVREDDGIDVVEIVHECLAERWPRLARWRNEDATDRALLDDVRVATRRWVEGQRGADLLWRGEALRELGKLTSRSTALTADELAFASASTHAEHRARRWRRTIVATAMSVLAVAAIVMAYLGLAANKSRSAAEKSAGEAREAAGLAEERLTSGLIAQGRRELNDNRALPALAYFAEAMKRGADSIGLRFMVAVASRGMRDEKYVMHGERSVGITALAHGFAIGKLDGTVELYDESATKVGEIQLGQGEVGQIRVRGDRLIALGRTGVAVVDLPTRKILVTLPISVLSFGDLGPGPDELTLLDDERATVYGLDGRKRRSIALDLSRTDSDPIFGDATVFAAVAQSIIALDLVTMKTRTIATEIYSGPGGSADGHTIVYSDGERRAHVLDGRGQEIATFVPQQRSEILYVSATGDRIAAVGDRALGVYDRSGKEIRQLPMSPQDEELIVRVRGDEIWTGSTHGVIRHYVAEDLVGSSPAHLTEIEDLRVAGDWVVSIGFDSVTVVQKANTRQLLLDKLPCEKGSYSMSGTALGYVCEGGEQHVFLGRRELATISGRNLLSVAIDEASGRAAITSKVTSVFDADRTLLYASSEAERGIVAFEDADHLVVARGTIGVPRYELWRLTLSTKTWAKVATLNIDVGAIVHARGGIFLGTKTGLMLWKGDKMVFDRKLDAGIEFLTPSKDGAWIAAHLDGGVALILDGQTGEIVRRLESVESVGVAAILDDAGDLVTRTSRGTQTVWERATGDNLLWSLEFLQGSFVATFAADGRIEIGGQRMGIIDIPRETRPVRDILATIACRVPLHVAGSRLESTPVTCP